MIQTLQTIDWHELVGLLQCPSCAGELAPNSSGLACIHCDRHLGIVDEMLVTTQSIVGNNRVTADFYDSPLWQKYRFWKRFTPFTERAVSKWRAEVFQHLRQLDNTRLLDVAIGAGLTVPLVPSSCSIFGVDVSIQQLNDCRDNNVGRNLKLVLGEAEELPFADNSFDNGLTFGAFNYFNDPLKSLQEMARVVKSDGLIVVTDEYADLPTRMIGHRIGWPALDRWILSKVLHLGDDFASLVNEQIAFKIEPIVDQVFDRWEFSKCCNGAAYCIVGRVKK